MMDLYNVVVFLATFIICTLFANLFKLVGKENLPNGPWTVPVFGSLPFIGDSIPKTFQKWWKSYGNIFRLQLGSMDTIVLNGYETLKAATEAGNDAFSSRPESVASSILKEANGGIEQVTFCPFNTTYLKSRKYIATMLRKVTDSSGSLSFHEALREDTDKLCHKLLLKASKGESISMNADLKFAVASVSYKAFFGSKQNQEDRKRRIKELIKFDDDFEILAATGNPLNVMPWLRYFLSSRVARVQQFLKHVVGLEDNQVMDHRDVFNEEDLRDVTDYFIKFEQENGHTSDGVLVSKCLFRSLKDLYFSGIATTSTTINWMLLYMISYPNIQQEVHNEIDKVIGDTPYIVLDDKHRLHFTMATINETLRVSSIVPFALPHSATSDVNFMGFDIRKDTPVTFNLYSANHDETVWEDPYTYRLERLLNEVGKLDEIRCRKIAAFGFGRRACAGERYARMEVFVIFTTLMQRFTFLKPADDELDLTPVPGITYKPKPFRVLVKERRSRV